MLMIFLMSLLHPSTALAQQRVDCHKSVTAQMVSDWELSKHKQAGVDCAVCRGDEHTSAQDVGRVKISIPDTCANCHDVANPDYALWHGRSEIRRDLTEIKALAEEMRRDVMKRKE